MAYTEAWLLRWGKTLDYVRKRKRTYQSVFENQAGFEVLSDLAKFCRANETCFHPDPRLHAALEGRREVWLRITQHLNLTSEQLLSLYRPDSSAPQGAQE